MKSESSALILLDKHRKNYDQARGKRNRSESIWCNDTEVRPLSRRQFHNESTRLLRVMVVFAALEVVIFMLTLWMALR